MKKIEINNKDINNSRENIEILERIGMECSNISKDSMVLTIPELYYTNISYIKSLLFLEKNIIQFKKKQIIFKLEDINKFVHFSEKEANQLEYLGIEVYFINNKEVSLLIPKDISGFLSSPAELSEEILRIRYRINLDISLLNNRSNKINKHIFNNSLLVNNLSFLLELGFNEINIPPLNKNFNLRSNFTEDINIDLINNFGYYFSVDKCYNCKLSYLNECTHICIFSISKQLERYNLELITNALFKTLKFLGISKNIIKEEKEPKIFSSLILWNISDIAQISIKKPLKDKNIMIAEICSEKINNNPELYYSDKTKYKEDFNKNIIDTESDPFSEIKLIKDLQREIIIDRFNEKRTIRRV